MYIKVKVATNSKKESFEKIKDDTYKICVKEKPIMGQANKAIIKKLEENLGIKGNKIRLVSGHTSPSKIFSIEE